MVAAAFSRSSVFVSAWRHLSGGLVLAIVTVSGVSLIFLFCLLDRSAELPFLQWDNTTSITSSAMLRPNPKRDAARGRWDVKGSKVKLWMEASCLALGVSIEVEDCVIQDASWFRKEDSSYINMAQFDAVVKRFNFALVWKMDMELLTDSTTVSLTF